MGECVNCSGPAAGTYTVAFAPDRRVADLPLCRGCHDFFSSSDRFELSEAPVLVRGSDTADE